MEITEHERVLLVNSLIQTISELYEHDGDNDAAAGQGASSSPAYPVAWCQAGPHLQGLRSPEGDAGMEGDLLICCLPQSRAGRRGRGQQGECRDEYLGCLAGAEPAVLPGGIAAWTGSSSFSILSFLSPRC